MERQYDADARYAKNMLKSLAVYVAVIFGVWLVIGGPFSDAKPWQYVLVGCLLSPICDLIRSIVVKE